MNGKKAKAIRKQAKALATQDKSYLSKVPTKFFTDLQNNKISYQDKQTVLHPMCSTSIAKLLKKLDNEGIDLTCGKDTAVSIETLVSLETTARLSELGSQGYQAG